MPQELERSHSLLVTAHHLAVDQAGAHLEVVHSLNHERVALRPVVAHAGDEPDAHGVAPGHEPKPIVLDLVNPVEAGRGLVRWGREARLDEARPVGGQALTHTFDQHPANLGGGREESNRNEIPARRIDRVAHRFRTFQVITGSSSFTDGHCWYVSAALLGSE
jgi:hypothetical protein